ncbi:MAG: histidinol-phosphate transaminase [Burkholderiales bacterium]
MDLCDLAPPYIRAIAPYLPGKPISELERELGIKNIVKLASNENPMGASPKALAAIKQALDEIARYPDGNGYELKAALSARLRVKQEQIVLGNGSNDVLELAARSFLAPGTEAIYAQHAFAVYALATQACGARGIEVPARNFGHDLDAMLKTVTAQTRIVFIANPNNPTGTLVPAEELLGFLRRLPQTVLVVLDEAYKEYLPKELKTPSVEWMKQFPNLVITRTFSKAYGLAGLRVGYALAQASVADLMNRVRQPFNVNSVSQAAARSALDDHEFVQQSFELNQKGMVQLTQAFRNLGLRYIPSYGNFVCFHADDAAALYQRLLRRGVIVRPIASYGMSEWLRVSIGLPQENDKFLQALRDLIHEAA